MDSSNNNSTDTLEDLNTVTKKTHSYSSIVKSNPTKTTDKPLETTDKLAETINELQDTTDKLPETTDKLLETTDKLPETTDKLPETTDKLQETTDEPTKTKRYAKTSTQKPINDKITFTEKNNSRNNNDDYRTALINASNIFLSECTLSNADFIEKEKAKIAKFRQNYAPTVVHKASYDKNFDAQEIGTQTIIFSRNKFAHNEMFRRKIGNIYKEMFDCDWVKIKDSTRKTEPNTLLISIGMNN
jgi:uncharacterized phage infection (PIP) family protein YhgE